MADKYGAGDDPDCYPGTDTLINLLNIKDGNLLEEAEREITSINAAEIEFSNPPYNLDYLCQIHKVLFQYPRGQALNKTIKINELHPPWQIKKMLSVCPIEVVPSRCSSRLKPRRF